MNQKTIKRLAATAATLLLMGFAPSAVWGGERAYAILKAMSDHLSQQQTLSLKFDSSIEVITPQIEKIQFTNSGEVLLQRPNHLRAHRVGGYSDAELVFDGETVSIYSKGLNAYGQAEMKGTVDELFEALRLGHAVAIPAADFLMSNPYEALIDDVLEAKHIGPAVIDGVRCEHLAFRNLDTDWQVWIEAGDQPMLRKVVITSKTLAGAPQYTLRIKHWDTAVQPAAKAFTFVIPEGASELGPDDFIKLDELPEGAPAK
jgi:hypothetical protein